MLLISDLKLNLLLTFLKLCFFLDIFSMRDINVKNIR